MSARIKAAAKALYAHNEAESVEAGAKFISMPPDEYDCCAKAALGAADTAMFSPDNVVSAATTAKLSIVEALEFIAALREGDK